MTGSLDESHYQMVREQCESDQHTLSHFSDNNRPTTIAVVSKPRDTDITEYCDEWMPELGMPEKHLKRFHKYKAGFVTNSAVNDPIQRAYDEARLDSHYRRYIRSSESAQTALSSIVSRLSDGEDVTLVCFEKSTEPCHRHLLIEMIESRLSSDFQFGEKEKELVTA